MLVEVLTALPLAIGTGLVLLCCIALLVVRDPFSRLHCASLASIAGPLAVATAAGIQDPLSPVGFRALLFALAAMAGAAITTHALGRALRVRRADEEMGQ